MNRREKCISIFCVCYSIMAFCFYGIKFVVFRNESPKYVYPKISLLSQKKRYNKHLILINRLYLMEKKKQKDFTA